MNKKYITPEFAVVELSGAICLNVTSIPADDTPAGTKMYHNIYEDTEEADGWDKF